MRVGGQRKEMPPACRGLNGREGAWGEAGLLFGDFDGFDVVAFFDFGGDVGAVGDLAEDAVFAVEEVSVTGGDVELGSSGVGVGGSGHGEGAGDVGVLVEAGFEGDGVAGATAAGTFGVTALDDEVG